MPDGTTAPSVLPDGTLPTYSSLPEGIHGSTYGGLQQEIAFLVGDLGYGRDLACFDDFTDDFQEIDPNSPLAVAQDAYHRLSTQRGQIPDDPDYGKDLKSLLQKAFEPNGVMQTKGQIRNELLKDDRIDAKTLVVDLTLDVPNQSMTVDVKGTTARGPFTLIMSASDAETLLQSMTGSS